MSDQAPPQLTSQLFKIETPYDILNGQSEIAAHEAIFARADAVLAQDPLFADIEVRRAVIDAFIVRDEDSVDFIYEPVKFKATYQRFADHASNATGPRPEVAATDHIELIQVRDKKQEVLKKLLETSVNLGLIPEADFNNPEIVATSLASLEKNLETAAQNEDSKEHALWKARYAESGRVGRIVPPHPRLTIHGLKMIVAKRKSESLVDYQKRMDAFISSLTANEDPLRLIWTTNRHEELSPPTDFQPDLSTFLMDNLKFILSRNEMEKDQYNVSELQLIASAGGDGSDRRMSILYDALAKIEAIDSETYASEAKSFEIRELLMKALFNMSQTIPGFDYKQTPKLAEYAYQQRWLEGSTRLPNKRSSELDFALRSILKAYGLDIYNAAELRATVYAPGAGFEERLNILQAALAEIEAIDQLALAPGAKQLRIKDALMRVMLAAGNTIPGFDLNTCPKLKAYADEQGWIPTVFRAIAEDLAQFYTANTDPKIVRSQAQMKYEQLVMAHSRDPQAALLFAQVDTTFNKINADVTRKHFNIDKHAFKLVVLQAYAQYMHNTQFLSKGDDEKLAQAQAAFTQTLRTQVKQFVTAKSAAVAKDAGTEFTTNLTTFANIMAENMVALSNQAKGRH